jgi:hypothetical protein
MISQTSIFSNYKINLSTFFVVICVSTGEVLSYKFRYAHAAIVVVALVSSFYGLYLLQDYAQRFFRPFDKKKKSSVLQPILAHFIFGADFPACYRTRSTRDNDLPKSRN